MSVSSNPIPVRKRFEHDEAEPSADKFCHTGTSIQDDSPKQKKIKESQRHPCLINERFKNAWKRRYTTMTSETLKYTWVQTKTFQMDDTNRLADYISELKNLPNWKSTNHTEKSRGGPGGMAERSKAPDSRNSSVENSGTRVSAWVRNPLLSENVLNTLKQSLQLTNSVILERQFKMTVQSKRKQKTRNVTGRLIAEQFKSAQKRGYPAETCKTRLYAWV